MSLFLLFISKRMSSSKKHSLKVRAHVLLVEPNQHPKSSIKNDKYTRILNESHFLVELDAPGCKRLTGSREHREEGGEEEIHGRTLSSSIISKLQRRTTGPIRLLLLLEGFWEVQS